MKLTDNYRSLNDKNEKAKIKYAFVVFRSMEGMARILNAYSLTRVERLWLYITCRWKNFSDKLFYGSYLDVKKAIDPSLILWENLGSSMWWRALRIVFIAIVAALLLSVTLIINVYS